MVQMKWYVNFYECSAPKYTTKEAFLANDNQKKRRVLLYLINHQFIGSLQFKAFHGNFEKYYFFPTTLLNILLGDSWWNS